MMNIRSTAYAGLASFLLALSTPAQGTWAPTGRITPAEGYGATDNHFGAAFAVRGDQALVGSPGIDGALGRAYLFERQGSAWNQQASWTTTDVGDDFGRAVALSADTILVGAPDYEQRSGSVHILALEEGEWVHAHALGFGAPQENARLGASVAVAGDTAFVGAPGVGAVHVLTRSGGTWYHAGQLYPGTPPREDFGAALAFDGVRLLVGSPEDDAVHVFESTGLPAGAGTYTAAWIETALLRPPGEVGNFGETVSLFGDEALVGAPDDDGEGAACLFTHDGTAWVQTALLTPSDSPLGSEFGAAVALGDGLALVGAPADEYDPGVAYAFKRRPSGWVERGRFVPDVGPGEVRFGYNVAITGRTLLINVGLDDSPIFGVYAGSVNTWEPSKPSQQSAAPGASVVVRRR